MSLEIMTVDFFRRFAGADSLKRLFHYASQSLDTTVYFSHGDTLWASYKPLTHRAELRLNPAPIEVRTLINSCICGISVIILSELSAVQTMQGQLKTNTALQLKDAGVEFRAI